MRTFMNAFLPILKFVWSTNEIRDKKRMKKEVYPVGIKEIRDIPYLDDSDTYHLLDIYSPENADKKLPLIIDIHGGGWMYGTKEINRCYCHRLAERGFVVANINYRLADKVMFAGQIKDIFDAFDWICKNAAAYGADMNHIFLTGDSAGGHFACVAAALCKREDLRRECGISGEIPDFKAVGATSPVIDLISPNIMMNVNLRTLLGSNMKKSPYYKYMKFDRIAAPDMPPFYICTSSGDFVRRQSYRLRDILNGLGTENKLRDWQCRYKGRKLPHVFSVVNSNLEPSLYVIGEMTDFFKKHM